MCPHGQVGGDVNFGARTRRRRRKFWGTLIRATLYCVKTEKKALLFCKTKTNTVYQAEYNKRHYTQKEKKKRFVKINTIIAHENLKT